MSTQVIIMDIKKAVCFQHKALTKAIDICKADKFILKQNRLATRNILTNIERLEDKFIFKKTKRFSEDTQILVDILTKKGE